MRIQKKPKGRPKKHGIMNSSVDKEGTAMTRRLRYGKGKSALEFDGTQRALMLETLNSAEPILMAILRAETERMKKEAEQAWPVRMSKYGESKGSKDRFTTGFRILPPSTVQAFVENSAPYAWAIRSGRGSKTPVTEGRRVAEELLWKPAKKNVKRITVEIAKRTVRRLKRVK